MGRRALAHSRADLASGLAAAAMQLAVSELAASWAGGVRSPVAGLVRAVIDRTPVPIIEVTLALVADRDKPLLMGSLVGSALGIGTIAGGLQTGRPLAGLGLMSGAGSLATLAAARQADAWSLPTIAAGSLGTGAGVITLALLGRSPRPGSVAAALLSAAGVGIIAVRRRAARLDAARVPSPGRQWPSAAWPLEPPSPDAVLAISGISPILTPNATFYVTDVTWPAPVVPVDGWRLRVGGAVRHELALTLDDLLEMPLVEIDAALVCVHNPVGGPRVGTARWLGVPVATLLEHADVDRAATHLVARSTDGFTAAVPLDLLQDGRPSLVAVGMNGEPLPVAHGFPARLLVPGLYGDRANTKWLAALDAVAGQPDPDYWTSRGWPSAPGHVRIGSRIDVPRDREMIHPGRVEIAGVAWAPPGGVRGVEIAVDGGPWQPARLAGELAPTAWRHWRQDWTATPGEHSLRVRAVGPAGPQVEQPAPPYPHGATGYHTIRVTVVPSDLPLPGIGGRRLRASAAELERRLALAGQSLAAWRRRRDAGAPPERVG